MNRPPAGRSDAATAHRDLRLELLDTAGRAVAERGWSKLTMASLGAGAGVSRQTVYNELGTKDDVARALVARELQRFLAVIEAELRGGPDPVGDIGRAIAAVLGMARSSPLLQAITRSAHGANSDLLPLLTTESEPLIDSARDAVVVILEARYPILLQRRATDLVTVADAMVRLVLSYVMRPAHRDDTTARDVAVLSGLMLGVVG